MGFWKGLVDKVAQKKEELEEHMKRDPIVLLRRHMQEAGEIDDAAYEKLDTEIKAIVEDALAFADASPEPPLEALFEDVLVETEIGAEQTDESTAHQEAASGSR